MISGAVLDVFEKEPLP